MRWVKHRDLIDFFSLLLLLLSIFEELNKLDQVKRVNPLVWRRFNYFPCARVSAMVKSHSYHHKQCFFSPTSIACWVYSPNNIVTIIFDEYLQLANFPLILGKFSNAELIWKKKNWEIDYLPMEFVRIRFSFVFNGYSSCDSKKFSWATKNHEQCSFFTSISSYNFMVCVYKTKKSIKFVQFTWHIIANVVEK